MGLLETRARRSCRVGLLPLGLGRRGPNTQWFERHFLRAGVAELGLADAGLIPSGLNAISCAPQLPSWAFALRTWPMRA